MVTTTNKGQPHAHRPKPGMMIEPVITYEELPIVTEAAREQLISSLQSGEEELMKGRGKLLSNAELKSEMRKRFEETTGFKLP
jgi:hypothetical protein